jgi:2,4-dienoyl-CoA reductase-like NADH-dependent reductase (Old Yellow Enzyme family)
MMSILFTPVKIKNMDLLNRFVRSATGDRFTEGAGYVSDKKVEFYSKLSEGGVGLIITGVTTVHPIGQTSSTQNSIASDDYIPGLSRLTKAVHERGAKIVVQLFHGGREAARFWNTLSKDALAPSYVDNDPYFRGQYRAMTEPEIREMIQIYGDAARRAREAGFDGVQIHGAHAYLPSQFLSPFSNHRKDQWGSSLENRLRFHREIYQDIRQKVGQDYPVLIKLGVGDGFAGGLEFDEGLQAAKLLAEWGYDSLEISQGLRGKNYEETEFRTGIDSLEQEGYFRDWCRKVKKQVGVPVMMVGGLRSFELLEEVITKKEADFVALCRPLIREPGIIHEWEKGSRRRCACISCNKCLEGLRKAGALHCVFNEPS